MKNKTIAERWYNLALYKHFIIFWVVAFILFGSVFALVIGIHVSFVILVALVISCVSTSIVYLGKQLDTFYTELDIIETDARAAKTVEELFIARAALRVYWQHKSFNRVTGNACNKILSLIDNRLEFEFKYVVKEKY